MYFHCIKTEEILHAYSTSGLLVFGNCALGLMLNVKLLNLTLVGNLCSKHTIVEIFR